MPVNRRKLGCILFPFSILYGIIVSIRNRLFNLNVLKSKEFNVPVISIGNITVGGTGKTPHAEYIIDILKNDYKIAVISRGYKRKTKDFRIATKNSDVKEIGDEPMQIKNKFQDVIVAVDNNRVQGIEKLLSIEKKIQTIILDDAFQHRYVKPGLSILLIDYNRPLNKDFLLPFGDLREKKYEIRRANIIIITKTPESIKPIEKRIFIHDLNPLPFQQIYFTSFKYNNLVALIHKISKVKDLEELKKNKFSVLLVTAIANSQVLLMHLKNYSKTVFEMKYPDHHYFTNFDIEHIERKFNSIEAEKKIIITTEKDATRLKELKIKTSLKEYLYYLPIQVLFIGNQEKKFKKAILDYVEKGKKVTGLHK